MMGIMLLLLECLLMIGEFKILDDDKFYKKNDWKNKK